jgi:hypothetical protein
MTRAFVYCMVLSALLIHTGCRGKEQSVDKSASPLRNEPNYVTVQHILIGFQGSIPGKAVGRTQEEAKRLAEDILARARAGEDFDALVKEYTDDSPPGVYKMANLGMPAERADRVFPRSGMVPLFGDVAFRLDVGAIGMAAYDPERSPYGWHIIKRLK